MSPQEAATLITDGDKDEWDPVDAVTVAYVNHNEVAYSWHHSMVELIGYDLTSKGRIMQGGYIAYRYGTDGLVDARNKAVEQFLQERDAQWLFWIDTDMGFTADTVDRLVAAADPVKRPIIGGLCFTQRETNEDGLGGWRTAAAPTIFDWVKEGDQQGFAIRWDYPADTVVPCAGTGSACILIHRSVFERMFEKYGRSWYDKAFNASMKQETSEDLSFCMRAIAIGIPVHVHTGVKTSHQKTVWLSENEYRAQRPPVPATEEVAVIVPVMRRPQNAAPFMRSLRASTGLATAFAIADADDSETIAAWRLAGATVLTMDLDSPGTFAQKINYGYECMAHPTRLLTLPAIPQDQADEFVERFGGASDAYRTIYLSTTTAAPPPWLLVVGDDVRFHPGWLDQAQAVAGDRLHVIGTNDLSNPRVTSGQHATHVLIRRSYVDDVGASWDGPKVVAHEGYRHWYVDDEIVTAAKQRGVWAMAINSHVEHLHPAWGKGAHDEVYELGMSFAEQDKATFEARLKENS
jgi:hypothetical protein